MRQLEEQIRVLVEESSARKRKRVPTNPTLPTPTLQNIPAQSNAGKQITLTMYLTF
jgi:hypothetical protein